MIMMLIWFFFVNSFSQTIREILLLGHRQAFAWIDDWISMTIADVRTYECEMQRRTNTKVNACVVNDDRQQSTGVTDDDYEEPRSPKSSLSPLASLFSPPRSSSSSSSGQTKDSTSWFSWWSLNWLPSQTIL